MSLFIVDDIDVSVIITSILGDMDEYIDKILSRIPPVEDYITCYPAGYITNIYFD